MPGAGIGGAVVPPFIFCALAAQPLSQLSQKTKTKKITLGMNNRSCLIIH
jgi:hypothetical protein